jgi:membrane protein DedA with SNARE-associated domain
MSSPSAFGFSPLEREVSSSTKTSRVFSGEDVMLTETILRWVTEYGYLGIFSLLTLGIVGVPIPDEGLLAFAGYLVYNGTLLLLPTMAAAILGSVCGITLSYGLGRTIGNYLITKFGPAVQITGDKITHVQTWFERVGKWGLLFGYYLPVVRHLIAFGAGVSKLPLSVFALFAYTGGFIWSASFIAAGYFLGRQWTLIFGKVRPTLVVGSVIAVALFFLYFFFQFWLKRK